MCERLICLISIVLVLALTGSASADLVAHWSFDNDAADSVGTLNWTLNGGAGYSTDAQEGSHSLQLNGTGDYASQSAVGPLIDPFSTQTVALWFKADSTSGTQVLYDEGGLTKGMAIRINDGVIEGAVRDAATQTTVAMSFSNTDWTHVAVTFDNGLFKLYVHGVEQDSVTASYTSVGDHSNNAGIGARNSQDAFGNSSVGDYFSGLIDDVRLYDNALSVAEIASLAGGYPLAYGPTPENGAIYENTWANLAWTAGTFAVSHDVYLGDNFDDVNTGAEATFQGNQGDASLVVGFFGFSVPEGLQPGTTYYWRIDEVNDADPNSPWKGDVWSFMVPPKTAYSSDPPDAMKFIDPDVALSWTGGLGSMLHHVYFGNNFDDVNNASGAVPLPDATYTPGALERGVEYYWRVDEFDGAGVHKGDVWSFRTIPPIAIGDPNLVGWWKLDEGMGGNVVDYSGYDHHGTIGGDTFWADGYDLGAMEFTGAGSYVEMTGYEGVTGTNPRTMTAWIRTTTPDRTILAWGVNTAGLKWRMRSDATGGLRAEVNGGYFYGETNIADGRWHHVAITWADDGTPDALDFVLYVDGQLDATADSLDEPIDTSAAGVVRIGESAWVDSAFVGLIDEVRIYDKVLTQEEIQLVMRINLQRAWAPSPTDGMLAGMNMASALNWSAGDGMSQHDVYLGPDQAAVEAADASDTTGIYRGRQGATSYLPPEGVDPNSGPFFWRIDEVANDGTIVAGRLWTFSVTDYALVDDMESYNSNNPIWENWLDGLGFAAHDNVPAFAGNGTGSAAGDDAIASSAEETTVHSGNKAMPVWYNNTTAATSEIEKTLSPAQDWTANSLQTLSLRFVGAAANVPGQLYVKVNGVAVNYPGDTGNLTLAGWQSWNIDLASFGGGLQNVTKIVIGVQGNGATGKLIFDDIRVYPYPRETITPVQPDVTGLVAHYAFEGNAADSTGANPGTAFGGALYFPGKIGQAISLDGLDDYVAIDNLNYASIGLAEVSVSAWIRTSLEDSQIIVAFDRNEYYRLEINGDGAGPGQVGWDVMTDTGQVDYGSNARVDDDQWHHVAGVFDNGKLTVYVDGSPHTPAFGGPTFGTGNPRFGYIGLGSESTDFNVDPKTPADFFTGSVDDVRIYDRALTDGEVAGLAGRTSPFDKPF